ncbi:hypothetical protein EZS27_019364 [termite gut metagenome]|uniref:ISAzo13 family transposase n=1 Tax=termite gut metagenome TaxID=433724 RepID=A0A5J4RDC9_9ZZZZ
MDTDLQSKFASLLPHLYEPAARLYLGSEALSLGLGGKQKVSRLAGVSRVRTDKGIEALISPAPSGSLRTEQRIRKKGGCRKLLKEKEGGLMEALEAVIPPHTRGDPMNPLLWASNSLRHIEKALVGKGYKVSHVTIGELLKSLGYGLQANRKTVEGSSAPESDKQFEYINTAALTFMSSGAPVISVDCKKKELIGNYKNQGGEWEEKKHSPAVKEYDFAAKASGKAVPYGVYDIAQNQAWVSVGIRSATAAFAVNTLRTRWQQMGREHYPDSKKLMITADGVGSNSSSSRLRKKE